MEKAKTLTLNPSKPQLHKFSSVLNDCSNSFNQTGVWGSLRHRNPLMQTLNK